MRESRGWAARLGLVALGFAALMVGSTVWAADNDVGNVVNATDVVEDLNVSSGSWETNNDGSATNAPATDPNEYYGGGILTVINDTSTLPNNLGALVPVDTIEVSGSVSNYTSTINWDNAGADSNGYGPVMILGGTGGVTSAEFTASFSNVTTNFNVLDNSTSAGGSSGWGGAAYLSALPDLEISNNSFDNVTLTMDLDSTNVADGTFLVTGGAVATFSTIAAETSLDTVTFSNNTVQMTGGSGTGLATAARGGALGMYNDGTGHDVEIANSVFANNAAINEVDNGQAMGGAIWAESGEMTITNTTFVSNSADADFAAGGAIWTDSDLTMDGVTFRDNTVNGDANAIYLSGGANIIFTGDNDSYDYDGVAADAAGGSTITMEGTGNLYLYGDYSNFDGDFILDDGITFFNDNTDINAASSLSIAGDAMLDLTGRAVGATITVDSLTLDADSILAVNLGDDNNVANSGYVPAIDATDVTIGGDFDLRVSGAIEAGETYQAIASTNPITDGSSGSWSVDNFMTSYTVDVNANDVTVTIDSMQSVAGIGVTRNQNSLGSYLDRNGGLGTDLWDYIYNDAQNEYDVRRALDTSSGDVYASAMGALAQWERRGNENILDRMNQVFWSDSPNAYASAGSNTAYGSYGYGSTDASGIWAEVEGFQFKSDRNNNAGQAKTKGWGVSLGYDKLVADWVFGIAFRYGDSRLDVHERLARVDIDSYSLSLYGGRRACVGPAILHLMGGVTGSYHDMDGRRTQILGPVSNTYTSDYHSKTLSAYADMGATFGDINRFAIQPFGNVMWNGVWSNSFTERGGSASDRLRTSSEDDDWWSTSLGIRAMARVNDCFGIDVNAAWRHTYGKLSATNRMRFAGTTGDRFTVRGTPLGRNEGVFGAGLNFRLGDRTYIRAAYDYTVGTGKAQSHEGNVSVGFSF